MTGAKYWDPAGSGNTAELRSTSVLISILGTTAVEAAPEKTYTAEVYNSSSTGDRPTIKTLKSDYQRGGNLTHAYTSRTEKYRWHTK
ncbi:hypothetical protein Pcinc_012815 [Petrolisthes cinctipes]|uniref:Uncharacterized protein n=1 Tax=Petrolisthes cinctipes TaxID=88211 RepID=A0AAE1G079_PETCI|nr:hypothetical protein Pcinc_012815 [Petrolisthes cinctipes]